MDSDAAEKLIDGVYKTGMSGSGWNQLLNKMTDCFHAQGAWIAFAQPSLQRYKIIAPRSNPDVIQKYQRHWWQYDLTTAVTSTAEVAQIASLADTGRKRFLASKFYNEFWRHSGQPAERLAVNLFIHGTSRISFGIQPKAQSEELEMDLINGIKALVPHLSRAAEIHCAMRRLELTREIAKAAPRAMAVLVDHEARVIFAQEDVLAFLERNESVRLGKGCLSLNQHQMQQKFQRLLSSCYLDSVKQPRGGTLFTGDEAGKPRLRIEVLPFQLSNAPFWGELCLIPDKTNLVIFTDLTQHRTDTIAAVRDLFELTPAQARVALELLCGGKRADVADRLGVELSTVRTHMMHVFEKAGVNSRSELINKMLRAGIEQSTLV